MTDDLALTPLPRILREFRRLHPQINLELTVLQNESLVRRVESGYVDLAFVKRSTGAPATNPGELVRRDQLVWVAAEGERLKPDQPVPLVVYLKRPVSVGRSASEHWKRVVGATGSRARWEVSTVFSRPCEQGWASPSLPGH